MTCVIVVKWALGKQNIILRYIKSKSAFLSWILRKLKTLGSVFVQFTSPSLINCHTIKLTFQLFTVKSFNLVV